VYGLVTIIGTGNAVKVAAGKFFNWETSKPWMMAFYGDRMPAVKKGRPMDPAASSRERSHPFDRAN
jgi:hypothetical protein